MQLPPSTTRWEKEEVYTGAKAWHQASENPMNFWSRCQKHSRMGLGINFLETDSGIALFVYIRDNILKKLRSFHISLRKLELAEPTGTSEDQNLSTAVLANGITTSKISLLQSGNWIGHICCSSFTKVSKASSCHILVLTINFSIAVATKERRLPRLIKQRREKRAEENNTVFAEASKKSNAE